MACARGRSAHPDILSYPHGIGTHPAGLEREPHPRAITGSPPTTMARARGRSAHPVSPVRPEHAPRPHRPGSAVVNRRCRRRARRRHCLRDTPHRQFGPWSPSRLRGAAVAASRGNGRSWDDAGVPWARAMARGSHAELAGSPGGRSRGLRWASNPTWLGLARARCEVDGLDAAFAAGSQHRGRPAGSRSHRAWPSADRGTQPCGPCGTGMASDLSHRARLRVPGRGAALPAPNPGSRRSGRPTGGIHHG